MKKFLVFILCLSAGIILAAGIPLARRRTIDYAEEGETAGGGLFNQEVVSLSTKPHKIYVLYRDGHRIGVVNNPEKLARHLQTVYNDKYKDDFPDASIDLADGLKVSEEESYFNWSSADDKIIAWLDRNEAYTLSATEIAFAGSTGIYARIYVRDLSLYENALHRYLSCFIDSEYLDPLLDGKTVSFPTEYGSADIGLAMAETVTILSAKASPAEIYTNEDDVLEYLEYGGNKNRSYYVVQEGDTLEAVGEKNGGLSVQQLVNINPDVLKGTDDKLIPGQSLCVTYFESPVTIQVSRYRLVRETVPYATDYVANVLSGDSRILVQKGKDGLKSTMYRETWVNGVLSQAEEVSSAENSKAVNEVKSVLTDSDRGIGTGSWQLPVDHAEVSCGWNCMVNYDAVSLRNKYNQWGNVYASDNGIVENTGYDDENGNWIRINHQNGMHSCYAHLQEPSSLAEGTIVQKGDVIGQIGITGASTYPHLKFWLEDDQGNAVNPLTLDGFPECPH